MLETPVVKPVHAVDDFQEKTFGYLTALEAVLHAEIAALIVISRIELASRIRTWTKFQLAHFLPPYFKSSVFSIKLTL